MMIHCFYSDLIISLKTMFDKLIFPGNIIKSYQFNIGNQSFQINENTNYELPAIIVNYTAARPFNYRPATWKNVQLPDVSRFPVLFNRTKDLSLMLQEELFYFDVEVIINCESSYQAIELEHIIQNKLILGKYLHHYKFMTFIEIGSIFLEPDMFDVNHDDIVNLFTKHNALTDNLDYCFSVEYEPLIKLNSVSNQISTSDQQSYTLNCQFEILNPQPVRMEIPTSQKSDPSGIIRTYNFENIIISSGEKSVVKLFSPPQSTNHTWYGFYEEDDDHNFNIPCIFDDYTGELSGHVKYVELIATFAAIINSEKHGIIEISKCDISIRINNISNTISADLKGGNINGRIVNCVLDLDQLSGRFFGYYGSIQFTEFIKGTLTNINFKHVLELPKLKNSTLSYRIDSVPVGNIGYSVPDLNARLSKINFLNTVLKKIDVLYLDNVYTIDINTNLTEYGTYNQSLVLRDSEDNELTTFSLNIQIDRYTLKLEYQVSLDLNIKILAFIFDLEFKSKLGYGARLIESISVDFSRTSDPISTSESFIKYVRNSFNEFGSIKNKKLVVNLILTKDIYSYKRNDDGTYKITLTLNEIYDYYSLLSSGKKHLWRFIFGTIIVENNQDELTFIEEDNADKFILNFKCSEKLFNDHFAVFEVDDSILFQIYEIL